MATIMNRLGSTAASTLLNTAQGSRLLKKGAGRTSGVPTFSPRVSGALEGVTRLGQKPKLAAPSNPGPTFSTRVSGALGDAKRFVQHPETRKGIEAIGATVGAIATGMPNTRAGAALSAVAGATNGFHALTDESRNGWARAMQSLGAAFDFAAAIALFKSQNAMNSGQWDDAIASQYQAGTFSSVGSNMRDLSDRFHEADQFASQGPVISTSDASMQTVEGEDTEDDRGVVAGTADASTQTGPIEEPAVKRTLSTLV